MAAVDSRLITVPLPRRQPRGFSLVELLVLIGIAVILISIFLPYVAKVRESDHRARCAENLRSLMSALRNYAAANKGAYPRVRYDSVRNPNGYVAYSGGAARDPFASGSSVLPNDVTASLWLLVRAKLIKPADFICPSTSDFAEPASAAGWPTRSNFTGGRNLSYSYACPFSSAPAYKLDDFLPADFALMADKNPGVARPSSNVTAPAWDAPPFEIALANSFNHDHAGQNVLYADGHVAFTKTPYCGYGHDALRDNIYTALSATPIPKGQTPPGFGNGVIGHDVGPAWDRDSYLVPTDQD
ncbi:MAG TPA: type II secretion system protein [Tepidisphaeraceae bacterium]|jgi:prepilin-type processing-associated H-X9-DG protein|nr:type II secretion system protein [Tepidisphaeraceae bacterium]